MNLRRNNGSSVLMLCLLVAVVGGITLSTALLLAKFYNDANADQKKKNAGLQASEFGLLLTSIRFQIKGTALPVWYPDIYPTQSELKSTNHKPLIQVLSPLTNTSNAMTVISEKIVESEKSLTRTYDLDITNMGSVLNLTDSKLLIRESKSQSAYISIGDMSKLSLEDMKNLFLRPTSSWPYVGTKLTNLESAKIYFDSYDTEKLPDQSLLIKGVNVTIERGASRNAAVFSIDVPPDPQCKISLPTAPVPPPPSLPPKPYLPGDSVTVNFTTSSITNSATIGNKKSGVDFTLAPQSIRNLGKDVSVSSRGSLTLTVPQPSTFPLNADGTKNWRITGTVIGVDSRSSPKTCSLDLKVVDPDAKPTVKLTINGQSGTIKVPYYSTVSVSWTSERATSCTLNGTASALSGTRSSGPLTVETMYTVTCKNAGGETSDSGLVKFNSKWYQVDGAYCPTYCTKIGKVNTFSVDYIFPGASSKCTSGEMRSAGAMAAGIKFTHGCWGDGGCPYPRTWYSPISDGNSCYSSVGKVTKDGDGTDVTVGCHCADP